MASTLITAYLGTGLLSARPATPIVAAGCVGLYFATDTALPYYYAAGAWVAGAAPAAIFTPIATSYSSTALTGAAQGTPFRPSLTMTFTQGYALLTTVAGGTYKMGFAPWNPGTLQMTGAPVYSAPVTAGFSAATQTLKFTFSATQTATAGSDYILFYVRTDSTAGVSQTVNYSATNEVLTGGPAYYRVSAAGAGMSVSSLSPLTSDVWTDRSGAITCAPIYSVP